MTFAQKLENLAKLKELLEGKKKQLGTIEKSIDGADESKVSELEKELSVMKDEIVETQKSIDDLEKEIADDEEKLKMVANDIAKNKTKESVTSMNKDYLKTKQALQDFADVQLAAKGDKDTFKKLWEEKLAEKGITNPEVLLPEPVATAIVDAFQASGTILATFTKTGLSSLKIARNTETGIDSRARGHKRGTDKKEQKITLATKTIRAQYIYKYITVDKETIRENQTTGAIMKYVLSELPQRVVMEIERAAVIGDGREANDDDKIASFEAMAAASTGWTAVITRGAGELFEDIVLADAEITAEGARYLVMARQTLAQLKLAKDANGKLLYPLGTNFAEVFGVSGIFTPDWMPKEPAAGEPVVVEYVGPAYKVVGDDIIDNYDNFLLAKNKMEYLAEVYMGGALAELKSAAVIKATAATGGGE